MRERLRRRSPQPRGKAAAGQQAATRNTQPTPCTPRPAPALPLHRPNELKTSRCTFASSVSGLHLDPNSEVMLHADNGDNRDHPVAYFRYSTQDRLHCVTVLQLQGSGREEQLRFYKDMDAFCRDNGLTAGVRVQLYGVRETEKYKLLAFEASDCTMHFNDEPLKRVELATMLHQLSKITAWLHTLHLAGLTHGEVTPEDIFIKNDGWKLSFGSPTYIGHTYESFTYPTQEPYGNQRLVSLPPHLSLLSSAHSLFAPSLLTASASLYSALLTTPSLLPLCSPLQEKEKMVSVRNLPGHLARPFDDIFGSVYVLFEGFFLSEPLSANPILDTALFIPLLLKTSEHEAVRHLASMGRMNARREEEFVRQILALLALVVSRVVSSIAHLRGASAAPLFSGSETTLMSRLSTVLSEAGRSVDAGRVLPELVAAVSCVTDLPAPGSCLALVLGELPLPSVATGAGEPLRSALLPCALHCSTLLPCALLCSPAHSSAPSLSHSELTPPTRFLSCAHTRRGQWSAAGAAGAAGSAGAAGAAGAQAGAAEAGAAAEAQAQAGCRGQDQGRGGGRCREAAMRVSLLGLRPCVHRP